MKPTPIEQYSQEDIAIALRKTLFGEDDRGWNTVDEVNRKAWREKADIFISLLKNKK